MNTPSPTGRQTGSMHDLYFYNRFAWKVQTGMKRTTIRLEAGCQPGDGLRLLTKVEQGEAHVLNHGVCTKVTSCSIAKDRIINVGGHTLDFKSRIKLIKNEGFSNFKEDKDNANDFYAFINELYTLPFAGALIEWNLTDQQGEPSA